MTGVGGGRVGISLPNRLVALGHPAGELLDLAVAAEASGLVGSVWVGDSLLAKPRLEAMTLLGALAVATSRVRLGTLCLASLPFRDPVLLALQVASVDRLSGGRLALGVCAGPGARGGPAARAELERFGLSSAGRIEALERGIGRLRVLLGQSPAGVGTATGAGDAGDPPVVPGPLQDRLPILLAATPPAGDDAAAERMLSRVGRLADGWLADALDPRTFRDLRARVVAAADAAGRPGAVREAIVHVPVVVAADVAAGEATARAFLAAHLGVAPEAVALPAAGAYGPPALLAERIAALLEAGVSTVVLRLLDPEPLAQLERALDALAR